MAAFVQLLYYFSTLNYVATYILCFTLQYRSLLGKGACGESVSVTVLQPCLWAFVVTPIHPQRAIYIFWGLWDRRTWRVRTPPQEWSRRSLLTFHWSLVYSIVVVITSTSLRICNQCNFITMQELCRNRSWIFSFSIRHFFGEFSSIQKWGEICFPFEVIVGLLADAVESND